MITQSLGILAAACFAFCGVPAAVNSLVDGRSQPPASVSAPIFIGACSMYYYITATFGFDLLLFGSYFVEIVSWGIILWYNLRPRK
jgi:hypothetical protein